MLVGKETMELLRIITPKHKKTNLCYNRFVNTVYNIVRFTSLRNTFNITPSEGRLWSVRLRVRTQVDCVNPDRPFEGFIS